MSQSQLPGSAAAGVEIHLSEEEADVARRLLRYLIDGRGSGGSGQLVELHQVATGIQQARKDRRRYLPQQLFAEPAWDILLSLYSADARQERFTVTDVGNAADLPLTSALRSIALLAEAGMIERRPDERDRRRIFVTLTDKARENISQWLSNVIVGLGAALAGEQRP